MFDVTSGVKGHKSAVASRRRSHELDMLGISGGRKCNSESVTLLKCVCVCSWKHQHRARNPDGMSTTATVGGEMVIQILAQLEKLIF